MPYQSLLRESYREEPAPGAGCSMDADLGLFNQLLGMVDGDWSDSIDGICSHIREKFNALAVSLSVFDKKYNEFIYVHYSLKEAFKDKLAAFDIVPSREACLDILKNVYSKKKDILEYGLFEGKSLKELISIYFKDNKKKSLKVAEAVNLQTVYAIPDLDASKDYTCFFHIITDSTVKAGEKDLINEYLTQLHVALEIVFLVRDLYLKATHDSLTKSFNHKQGMVLLNKEIDRIQRNKQPLSVAVIDIDNLKGVNKTHGHKAGNQVIEFIGKLLNTTLRKCDLVSRYGGEEFLLVFPDTARDQALEVVRRLKNSVENHTFSFQGKKCSITASIGICQYDRAIHSDALSVISEVNGLLYRAKELGSNRIEY